MARTTRIVLCAFIIYLLFDFINPCELNQMRNGCKMQGQCICGFGCKSEFRYSSMRECKNAVKARGSNICSRLPCLNNGICIQVSQEPGFKCRCESTGFYGQRCERACPTNQVGGHFPYECIVI